LPFFSICFLNFLRFAGWIATESRLKEKRGARTLRAASAHCRRPAIPSRTCANVNSQAMKYADRSGFQNFLVRWWRTTKSDRPPRI